METKKNISCNNNLADKRAQMMLNEFKTAFLMSEDYEKTNWKAVKSNWTS